MKTTKPTDGGHEEKRPLRTIVAGSTLTDSEKPVTFTACETHPWEGWTVKVHVNANELTGFTFSTNGDTLTPFCDPG